MPNRIFSRAAVAIAFSLVQFSCAHSRTGYHPHSQHGGYSQADVTDYLLKARFAGNASTHPDDAKLFAQFRAIEICREIGFKFARIFAVDDQSQSQTVQRSSTFVTQNPTIFNGTMNSQSRYNRYNGPNGAIETNGQVKGTFTGGGAQAYTSTWNQTYNYPVFDSYFNCSNSPTVLGILLEPKSASEMRGLTSDLMGALQVAEIGQDSANYGNLQRGDLIIKVGTVRIDNVPLLAIELDKAGKVGDRASLTLLRDGKQISVQALIFDASEEIAEVNATLVERLCRNVREISERRICASRSPASE